MWPWPKKVVEAHNSAITGSIFVPNGPAVLTSSGSSVGGPENSYTQGWQTRAWFLWECIGEVHSPTEYLARVVSRRINWLVDSLDNEQSLDLMKQACGSSSVEELIRLMVLNLQVAGEFWLIMTAKYDETDGEITSFKWDIVSVADSKRNDKVDTAKKAGLPYLRVYDPNPRDTDFATSSVRSIIEPAEDLLTLTALSRAQSRSRIAQAGILLVPSEARKNGSDPFGSSIEEAMVTAIRDVHSPAAVAPVIIEIPGDTIESVRHIAFERQFDDSVPGKVEQAIRRIALGLDIPPELLLGMSDINHWSAWVTQEETYRGSIAPLAEKVAGVFEYIVLKALDQTVRIAPDALELLTRKATVRDSIDAARIGAVGLEFIRKTLGATDIDKPTAEDLEILAVLASSIRRSSEAPVNVTQLPPGGGEPE